MERVKHKTGVDWYLNKCRHFTGVQHEACKAGVRYDSFRNDTGAIVPLPCLKDDGATHRCALVDFYTRDEAEALERESQVRITEYLEALGNGHCPVCKVSVTHRQVGHCVYGSCGHRLYQGTVNPKFAEQEKP